MAGDKVPDLSPRKLRRLRIGMTRAQVEAILGPYLRPNVHEGRTFFAWIGEGAMLRAFFDGPGGTLARAVLDVPDEQRALDLGRAR
jgi:hypothetical protein